MLAFSVRVLTSINVLNDPLAVYQQMLARDFGDQLRDHWQTNVTTVLDDLTVEKMWSKFKSGICIHRQSATLSLYQFWLYSHYQIPMRSDQKESSAGWIKLRLIFIIFLQKTPCFQLFTCLHVRLGLNILFCIPQNKCLQWKQGMPWKQWWVGGLSLTPV